MTSSTKNAVAIVAVCVVLVVGWRVLSHFAPANVAARQRADAAMTVLAMSRIGQAEVALFQDKKKYATVDELLAIKYLDPELVPEDGNVYTAGGATKDQGVFWVMAQPRNPTPGDTVYYARCTGWEMDYFEAPHPSPPPDLATGRPPAGANERARR